MRRKIDIAALYADALKQVRAGDRRHTAPRPWAEAIPLTLDQLLHDDADDLLRLMAGGG
ncbi:MAG TPA: hypothetical protein VFG12_14235 [Rhodopila sp.]|jgi:hypothetical protein|nr:hypothetical protein [Rhodopila sp.]